MLSRYGKLEYIQQRRPLALADHGKQYQKIPTKEGEDMNRAEKPNQIQEGVAQICHGELEERNLTPL